MFGRRYSACLKVLWKEAERGRRNRRKGIKWNYTKLEYCLAWT